MPSDEVSEVLDFAQEFDRSIQHAIRAHSECARTPGDAVRYHDRLTPYAVHPIWCATTLLSDTHLSAETRRVGYQALLWHDVLEDTDLGLPAGVDPAVAKLVEGMTFNSFAEERREVWERPSLVKLLKLYDKVSNLLDGSWVSHEKWDVYVEHASKLNRFVREKYGELNITRMALPFLAPRPVVGPGGLPGMAIDPLTQLPNRNSVLSGRTRASRPSSRRGGGCGWHS